MSRGLLVGRFQPFHRGHLAVVQAIRKARPAEPLLLAIGSAQESYTLENPFTAGERAEMIERALKEARVEGVSAHPVVDIDRHSLWVAHVETTLPPFARIYTNNPLTRLLFERAKYAVESPALIERERFEGARIRALMAEGGDWTDAVPSAVIGYIREIKGEERVQLLAAGRPSGRGR